MMVAIAKRALRLFVLTFPLVWASSVPARTAEALAAVAANFADAATTLSKVYEAKSGHRIVVTTGSTGKLYAQISAGAPFDVFLSADAATPERLEREGHAANGVRFTYAVGRLALWTRDPARRLDDAKAALLADDVRHIAIANPALAPYGVAAREVLQNLGVLDSVAAKIVMGENIGQTHAMVASGNAPVGFVALSAIVGPNARAQGVHWEPPQALFTPIRQAAVLLKRGADNPAAAGFLTFIRSAEARQIIESYGYNVGE